jgi:hypothetical protein
LVFVDAIIHITGTTIIVVQANSHLEVFHDIFLYFIFLKAQKISQIKDKCSERQPCNDVIHLECKNGTCS